MKIEKYIFFDGDFYYYYKDIKTTFDMYHGLKYNSKFNVGYNYHRVKKGFWLRGLL